VAIPTSYTQTTLATFLHDELGSTLTGILDWSVAGLDYDEPIYDALFFCDETDIAEFTTVAEIVKLRLFARLYTWKKAKGQLTIKYAVSEQGKNLQRDQIFDHIDNVLKDLLADASHYPLPDSFIAQQGAAVTVGQVVFPDDPWDPDDDSEYAGLSDAISSEST